MQNSYLKKRDFLVVLACVCVYIYIYILHCIQLYENLFLFFTKICKVSFEEIILSEENIYKYNIFLYLLCENDSIF